MSKEEARQKVLELIARYQVLPVKKYNEEATKQGFILPLFKALGWNVEDSFDEVVPEEKASNGRVDYAFKINGVSQFYLEAKPLKHDLNDPNYFKQVTDYAYYKGITWAILTNFTELRVINALEHKPFVSIKCEQFIADFDDLWLLSHEAFEQGLLLKKAAIKYGAFTPPPPIEQMLYHDLRQWRAELSGQLQGHNKELSRNQIDEIIQKFLNRLIFIRTCEDRGIENKEILEAVHQWERAGYKGELLDTVKAIFARYEGWYDSDIFAKHLVDTDKIFIEGPTVKDILGGIAKYPFDLIDADVLGAVYEQYLGFVAIEDKESQRQLSLGLGGDMTFRMVDKKKYRKEQGIYYTPKFITDYIVKETVGHFIIEHTYNEVRNVKILDPACGSGSFLIRAFDELLNYHANQKGQPVSDLDQWERLPVLTGNIFGVDLDTQAVEIARLNLLLRCLAKRGILEPLANNIRPGNSLISGDAKELSCYFGNIWHEKKPFSWEQQFTDIIASGGFDVVIGNPPYVRIQALPRDEADYYRDRYQSAFGSFDLYVLFIEKALSLLKPGGRLGFITSGKFLKADYGKKLQQIIRNNGMVENIVDLSAQQIFGEATTYPAVIILRKGSEDAPLHYRFVPDTADLSHQPLSNIAAVATDQAAITEGMWPPVSADDSFLKRIRQNTLPLGELAHRVFVGLQTSADKVYILEKYGNAGKDLILVRSNITGELHKLEAELLKPFLTGKNIRRYFSPVPRELLLFPYHVSDEEASLIPEKEFETKYPRTWEYLNLVQNRSLLEEREAGKFKGGKWYRFGRTQNLGIHNQPKLAIPSTVKRLTACYDAEGILYLDNVRVNGILLKEKTASTYKYVLALFNSSLLHWIFTRSATPFANGWFGANRQFIESLPIRSISFNNSTDRKLHDDLLTLVNDMLELNKRWVSVQEIYSYERDEVFKEIERKDQEIDNLVYDLYGLTEKERKIVEESVKK